MLDSQSVIGPLSQRVEYINNIKVWQTRHLNPQRRAQVVRHRPTNDVHPADDRIVDLALHLDQDGGIGWDVAVQAWWKPPFCDARHLDTSAHHW